VHRAPEHGYRPRDLEHKDALLTAVSVVDTVGSPLRCLRADRSGQRHSGSWCSPALPDHRPGDGVHVEHPPCAASHRYLIIARACRGRAAHPTRGDGGERHGVPRASGRRAARLGPRCGRAALPGGSP